MSTFKDGEPYRIEPNGEFLTEATKFIQQHALIHRLQSSLEE